MNQQFLMAKEKIIHTSARLTGFLLLGASVLHSTIGAADVLNAIKVGDIRQPAVPTVLAVWIFSSIMLFLSGLWVLFIAGDLRKLLRKAWWQGILVGLGYAAGAIGAMAIAGVHAHLVAFALIGLLLLIPLVIWAGSFGSSHIKSTVYPQRPSVP
ncbi:MAG TPA: hypothetical protein VD996_06130 [Chitinophagaceae bacterium]|nr:hypothetical protein [Chitinophagaceae bacterium]